MHTYTIHLTDQQTGKPKAVTLDFGSWTFMRFCKINGNLPVSDLSVIFSTLALDQVFSLMLCAAENHHKKQRLTEGFNYTDVDAGEWVDALGGISGEGFKQMFTVVAKSINPDYQGVEILTEEKEESEEKKSQSAGMTSELTASGLELETAK